MTRHITMAYGSSFQKQLIEIFTREKIEKPVVVTVKQRIVNINHSASMLGICIGNNLETAHMLADNSLF